MRWFRITRFIRSTRLTAGLQYTDSTRCVRRFIPYFFTARLALASRRDTCARSVVIVLVQQAFVLV